MYNRSINEQDDKAAQYQKERIEAFDVLENRLDVVKKLLRLAKIETIKAY